jgi:alcohol dehydrogenase
VELIPFDFQPLTRIIFGPGSMARLADITRELGGKRILVVTDPGLEAAGHPQRALASLLSAGLDAWIFDGVQENPTTEHVEAGLQAARGHRIDFLIAVGGGSSMDCAKGINFLYTNGGVMSDYWGIGKATRPMLPSVAVPTTAGTGSEGQSYALIADARTHMKMACGDRKAAFRAAVLDPEVTRSQPRQVTAVTGIDALSHAVESFVCTRRSTISQLFSREAWRLLDSHFETVLREPDNVEARGAMQLGAHFAGVAIETSMLGACHACANPLTAHYGITHGIAIGVLLPHIVRFNRPVCRDWYHNLTGLGQSGEEATDRLASRIDGFLRLASLPRSLEACGVPGNALGVLAQEASQQWTARFNPRPVTEGDLLGLYQSALC